jgi:hypothetical protein
MGVMHAWRPLRVSDLPKCIVLAKEPVGALAGSARRAERVFSELLRNNVLTGVAIVDSMTGELEGFGSVLSVHDSVMERIEADVQFSFLEELVNERIDHRYLLTLSQQEALHRPPELTTKISGPARREIEPGGGVNLIGAFSGWSSESTSIKDALARSVESYLSGLYVKRFYKQIFSLEIAESYAMHFGLKLHERINGSYLAGLSRQDWQMSKLPAKPINQVFEVKRCRYALSMSERRLMQLAILDPSLPQYRHRERLGLTEVTSTVRSVKQKLGFVGSEKKRSHETWHELVSMLSRNPAELRPWTIIPEQLR